METNPLNYGAVPERAVGTGAVSRKMIRERAIEIGLTNGHPVTEVTKTEWEQAKRELTDDSALIPKPALPQAASEAAHDQTTEECCP